MSDPSDVTDRPRLHSKADSLLSAYPGTALLVRADGAVLATNVKGIALEAIIREEPLPELMELIREAAKDLKITARTVEIEGRRGPMVLEVSVIPQVISDNLLVLINDMTMERNLRSALAGSRQRYKDMVELARDFCWEVDADGVFTFSSPGGALGYTANDFLGRSPKEFLWDPEILAENPFLSRQELSDVRVKMRRADGTVALMSVACRPLLDDGGDAMGTRGVCSEVAENSVEGAG